MQNFSLFVQFKKYQNFLYFYQTFAKSCVLFSHNSEHNETSQFAQKRLGVLYLCFCLNYFVPPLRKLLVCVFSSLSSILCISHFLLHYFNCVSFFWVLRRLLRFSYTSLTYIFLEIPLLVTVSNMNFNLTIAFFHFFKQSTLISFILTSCLN